MIDQQHVGSNFDDFLRDECLLDDAEAVAAKRVVAFQIAQEMKRAQLTKTELAQRMKTSRPESSCQVLAPLFSSISLKPPVLRL